MGVMHLFSGSNGPSKGLRAHRPLVRLYRVFLKNNIAQRFFSSEIAFLLPRGSVYPIYLLQVSIGKGRLADGSVLCGAIWSARRGLVLPFERPNVATSPLSITVLEVYDEGLSNILLSEKLRPFLGCFSIYLAICGGNLTIGRRSGR